MESYALNRAKFHARYSPQSINSSSNPTPRIACDSSPIAKIAAGEIDDMTTEVGKNGAVGMTAKKRSEIAKKAAKSRWGK